MTDDRRQRSWLTRLLEDNPEVLRKAAGLAARLGGDQQAYVSVRRMLDSYLRDATGWLRDSDYGMIAHELDDSEHARLLWKVAGVGTALAGARHQWEHRYAARPVTDRELAAELASHAGMIDYDPDGPVRGIDGAFYAPGYIERNQAFAVLIYGTGMTELVTGFKGYDAQRQWLASRGPTAVGELTAPDLVTGRTPRLVREEIVLAWLLRSRARFTDLSPALTADTFTADGRYEIFAAMTALASRAGHWDTGELAEELARRADWLPDQALRGFGGDQAPWLHAYLRRLDQTTADAGQARRAARALCAEDSRARHRNEHTTTGQLPGQRPDLTARPGPVLLVIPFPQQHPPHPDGPVPRM